MKNNPVIIDLKNISVSFDDHKILDNINLYIRDGEFITFLGPSGCGKTTTLRIIAGFLQQDSGDVIIEGKNINGVPAYKRQVNTIFQRYALFPHLNVYENIAFGLRLKKWKEKDIKEKVSEMLALVNLKGFGPRKIDSLSGGQKPFKFTRVSISLTFSLISFSFHFLSRSPNAIFSYTFRCGKRA